MRLIFICKLTYLQQGIAIPTPEYSKGLGVEQRVKFGKILR